MSIPYNVRVLIDGEEKNINSSALHEIGISGPIRVFEKEFNDIQFTDGLYGHFNLAETGHVVGHVYLLVKIIHGGVSSDNPELEVEPLLSFDGAIMAECVEVENNIPFDKLDTRYFIHPMKGILNSEDLEERIFERYQKSRPGLTKEMVHRMGVGYTLLRFIKVFEIGV
jgi:hypothetical protein